MKGYGLKGGREEEVLFSFVFNEKCCLPKLYTKVYSLYHLKNCFSILYSLNIDKQKNRFVKTLHTKSNSPLVLYLYTMTVSLKVTPLIIHFV